MCDFVCDFSVCVVCVLCVCMLCAYVCVCTCVCYDPQCLSSSVKFQYVLYRLYMYLCVCLRSVSSVFAYGVFVMLCVYVPVGVYVCVFMYV